MSTHTSK